jgi:hypothetical protein
MRGFRRQVASVFLRGFRLQAEDQRQPQRFGCSSTHSQSTPSIVEG